MGSSEAEDYRHSPAVLPGDEIVDYFFMHGSSLCFSVYSTAILTSLLPNKVILHLEFLECRNRIVMSTSPGSLWNSVS